MKIFLALLGIDRIIPTLSLAGYCADIKEPMDSPPAFPNIKNQETPVFRPEELVCYCFGHTREDLEPE